MRWRNSGGCTRPRRWTGPTCWRRWTSASRRRRRPWSLAAGGVGLRAAGGEGREEIADVEEVNEAVAGSVGEKRARGEPAEVEADIEEVGDAVVVYVSGTGLDKRGPTANAELEVAEPRRRPV